MSEREKFEQCTGIPDSAFYNEKIDSYCWLDYQGIEHPFNELYESFKDGVRAGQKIPDGWAIVPVNLTDEMINAGLEAEKLYKSGDPGIWEAMVMAAPEPPKFNSNKT